jgi:hypothetical protein
VVERCVREANHSPLSCAEVKNGRAIPPVPGWLSRYSDVRPAGIRFPADFTHSVQMGPGAHPAFYPMGTGDKAAGCEAVQTCASNSEVKNGGAIPPLPMLMRGVVLN